LARLPLSSVSPLCLLTSVLEVCMYLTWSVCLSTYYLPLICIISPFLRDSNLLSQGVVSFKYIFFISITSNRHCIPVYTENILSVYFASDNITKAISQQ
jgi:hypothetical protein